MKCTATKADGSPCRASAIHADPEGRCVFHSSLSFPGQHRSSELTKEEAIRTVTQAIRALRKTQRDPVERADALRNLIVLWQSLTVPEVEPPPRPLTSAERIKKIELEAGR
jgi:hypothetical protein